MGGKIAEEPMGFTALYVIEALPALSVFLSARLSDEVLLGLLLQPRVLANREGGKTTWTEADNTTLVKLFFLASLHDYDTTVTDEGFREVFETDQLTEDMFDRWWSIRRLEIDNDTDWYMPLLAGCLRRNKVGPIANERVAERLAWIQRQA
jgi:hypothetical protein